MLIVDRWISRLGRPEAGFIDLGRIGRDQHSPARRRDDLVSVEGKDSDVTEGTDLPATVQRAHRFRSVLEDRHTMLPAGLEDRIQIGTLAVEMNDHDDLWETPDSCPQAERLSEEHGVQIPALRGTVEQRHARAEIENRIDAGHEREGGREHLVAGTDAE